MAHSTTLITVRDGCADYAILANERERVRVTASAQKNQSKEQVSMLVVDARIVLVLQHTQLHRVAGTVEA